MSKFYLSIIIPTYKRNEKLKKIINQLISISPLNFNIQILIINNIKKKSKFNFTKKKNVKIQYLYVKKNSNAIKRNKGIKFAVGNNLILIDDDCLPEKNFISDYIKLFKKLKNNEILCGSVKYLKNKINSENFIRYRQSRHFISYNNNLNRKINLKASKVVTMNMGMKNSRLLKKTNYFDKKFGGYGFEDYEFGFRLIKQGFKFIPTKPTIFHLDERNYQSYLNKIYFLARHSVKSLKKINYDSWKNTIYFKIENNFLVNVVSKSKLFYILIEILERFIVFIEKNIFLYLPNLYRFGIFLSYCRGYYDRKRLKKRKKYDWYK